MFYGLVEKLPKISGEPAVNLNKSIMMYQQVPVSNDATSFLLIQSSIMIFCLFKLA